MSTSKRKDNNNWKENRSLYWTGWALLVCALVILGVIRLTHFDYTKYTLPCILNRYTGFYCPGCGGTRAVTELLHGRFLRSLYYHPLVLYTAAIYVWFMCSNTVEILSRGKYKIGMRYSDKYLYIAGGILLLNFVVRNAILMIWGIGF